tara:strand:+ start:2487 stop:3224 length:738 start_codon:yes stop_codon:yes gene_type:complete
MMAKKGERKSQKRISASKVVKIGRKAHTWLLKEMPGAHTGRESMALGVVMRDLMELTNNMQETKLALSAGAILVNGVIRRSTKFPVGLFDIISIPSAKKYFRIMLDKKGRFELQAITEKETASKLCKIIGKKTVKKGMIQLETNDGKTLLQKKSDLKPFDSILVSLSDNKILKEIKLDKGRIVYIVGGEHSGETAKVKDIIAGTMKRPKLVSLEEKDSSFLTVVDNIFVIGESKPDIGLKVKDNE